MFGGFVLDHCFLVFGCVAQISEHVMFSFCMICFVLICEIDVVPERSSHIDSNLVPNANAFVICTHKFRHCGGRPYVYLIEAHGEPDRPRVW